MRPVGGWLSDKLGGARVTFWNFVAMAAAAGGVLAFLPEGGAGGSFPGFLAMFLLLFVTSGIGNGSTFRMIPVIFSTHHERLAGGARRRRARAGARRTRPRRRRRCSGSARPSPPTAPSSSRARSAISMKATGSPAAALLGFIAVYVSCIAVTWWFYSRRKAEMPC